MLGLHFMRDGEAVKRQTSFAPDAETAIAKATREAQRLGVNKIVVEDIDGHLIGEFAIH